MKLLNDILFALYIIFIVLVAVSQIVLWVGWLLLKVMPL